MELDLFQKRGGRRAQIEEIMSDDGDGETLEQPGRLTLAPFDGEADAHRDSLLCCESRRHTHNLL